MTAPAGFFLGMFLCLPQARTHINAHTHKHIRTYTYAHRHAQTYADTQAHTHYTHKATRLIANEVLDKSNTVDVQGLFMFSEARIYHFHRSVLSRSVGQKIDAS